MRWLARIGLALLALLVVAAAVLAIGSQVGLDRERLLEMARKAREAARPDAAERVADVCEAIASA